MDKILKEKKYQFSSLVARRDGVSPLKRLESGYAFVSDQQGNPIDTVQKLNRGDVLEIHMRDGSIEATVDHIFDKES